MQTPKPTPVSAPQSSATRGFTLVETLVALFLLTVAIMGPLSLASKVVQGGRGAEANATAFFLAQEGVEFVKGVRNAVTPPFTNDDDWLGDLSLCVNKWCDLEATAVNFSVAVKACGGSGTSFADCDYLEFSGGAYQIVPGDTGLRRGIKIEYDSARPYEALAVVRVEYEVNEVVRPYELKHMLFDVLGAQAAPSMICGNSQCEVGETEALCPLDCGAGGGGDDTDGDSYPDATDTCWCVVNNQSDDNDSDGTGDACDWSTHAGSATCCDPDCGL